MHDKKRMYFNFKEQFVANLANGSLHIKQQKGLTTTTKHCYVGEE